MNRGSLGDVTAALTLREQSHRRAVLWAIASLLILSTSPVFAHHLAIGAQSLLGGVDHLGAFCLTALHLLLAPVHYGFHLVLAVGLVYAVWDRWRAWRAGARAIAPLDVALPIRGDPFWKAAQVAGVEPRRLRLVDGLPSPALTIGSVRPLIYVARELAAELTPDELAAVLAHETAHVMRRDPLRLSLLRFLACTLFWIPALRRLADDMADEAEILADDRASRGRPLVLATAILTLAQRRSPEPPSDEAAAFVGFYRADLLDRRIRRLAGQPVAARSHLTRRSVLGALAALSLAWVSGVVMAHPLPTAMTAHPEAHCDHQGESPLRHLFCLGEPFAPLAHTCPHGSGHSHA
ncbi:MAG: M56 family metallopeptidase [Gemmatimonadales bacterium]